MTNRTALSGSVQTVAYSPAIPARNNLSAAAITSLRSFFETKGHHPSRDHWSALQNVAQTMQEMAEGTAPAKVFLSAVDPGVGKTQTVVHFARALLASPDQRHVGMIICVGRINETGALARELMDHRQNVAVLTSDEETNALGGADTNEAQILITTQQRVERATDGRPFSQVASLHYRGSVRSVRVWDEAWLPGVTATLTRNEMLLLIKPIQTASNDLADAVLQFALEVPTMKNGDPFDVPDFSAMQDGVSLYDVGGLNDEQDKIRKALLVMSGRRVRVVADGATGNTLLTYKDTFPTDMMPLLVLDASGRVRHTYADIEEHRGNLVRLPSAVKDYAPLTISVWNKAGSKDGWRRKGDQLLDAMADTINSKAEEPWLVVAHKQSFGISDIGKRLMPRLSDAARANTEVITWGMHMATNAYGSMPNVILAGTLFMRPSANTALTHLAQGRPPGSSLASSSDIADTERGEHRHHILQAICRGRVRHSDGERCHPMNAYIIASLRSGIRDDLGQVFPGCQVLNWKPIKDEPTGKVKLASDYIRGEIADGTTMIPYTKVQTAIRVDRRNFRQLITSKDSWSALLEKLGLETYGTDKRDLGVKLRDPDLFGPRDDGVTPSQCHSRTL